MAHLDKCLIGINEVIRDTLTVGGRRQSVTKTLFAFCNIFYALGRKSLVQYKKDKKGNCHGGGDVTLGGPKSAIKSVTYFLNGPLHQEKVQNQL